MNSIQTKFITLILGCALVCSAVIGGAGILSSKQVIDEDSAMIMNYLCSESTLELDGLFPALSNRLILYRCIRWISLIVWNV